MRKMLLFVFVAFVLGMLLSPVLSDYLERKVVTAVSATEPNFDRLRLQARVKNGARRELEAYCDTGNGVMVYTGWLAGFTDGMTVSAVPNGCEKSK